MSTQPKILFFTSRIPYPLEKGDKLRAYHQIKHLSKKCDVVLCCISQQPISQKAHTELSKITSSIHVYQSSKLSTFSNMIIAGITGFPFQIGYFFNSGAHYFFKNVIKKEAPDHIFVQLIRMAEYAIRASVNVPKSLDYMDAFSKGIERRMLQSKGIKRFAFKLELNRLKKYEAAIANEFDNTYIISEQDKASFNFPAAAAIKISRNGVDHHFFTPYTTREKKYDLVFTGNMSYPPNVDAALYIAEKIMPQLTHEFPDIKVLIAGATPTPAVKNIANKNIEVSGWLDDIRDAYNNASIFLAPLQIGTGLQNKLLEAMAMEMPCITSHLANNALGAVEEKEILLANQPHEYVEAITKLMTNDAAHSTLAKNGKQFITTNFNWNAITDQLYNDWFSEATV